MQVSNHTRQVSGFSCVTYINSKVAVQGVMYQKLLEKFWKHFEKISGVVLFELEERMPAALLR